MNITEPLPAAPMPKRRWYRLTPDRVVITLLAVEVLLWLSDRFGWLPWPKGYAVLTAVATVGVVTLLMFLWFATALIFRRRFQFGIRSLLILMVAVAIPCSLLGVEMQEVRKQREARAKRQAQFAPLRALGGHVYDGCGWVNGGVYTSFDPKRTTDATLERLKGLIPIDGLDFTECPITDTGLEHLNSMRQLTLLHLYATRITDAGLEHLKELSHLRELSIGETSVTDAGLEHLKELSHLCELSIGDTSVTDAGLEHLKGMSQLKSLDLCGTRVTDAGLEHLKGLSQLQWLYLSGTQVTDAGVKKLQQTLPKCKIE